MFAIGIKSDVGIGQGRIKEDLARKKKTMPFKLCNDNGELHYEGQISESWFYGSDEGSFLSRFTGPWLILNAP